MFGQSPPCFLHSSWYRWYWLESQVCNPGDSTCSLQTRQRSGVPQRQVSHWSLTYPPFWWPYSWVLFHHLWRPVSWLWWLPQPETPQPSGQQLHGTLGRASGHWTKPSWDCQEQSKCFLWMAPPWIAGKWISDSNRLNRNQTWFLFFWNPKPDLPKKISVSYLGQCQPLECGSFWFRFHMFFWWFFLRNHNPCGGFHRSFKVTLNNQLGNSTRVPIQFLCFWYPIVSHWHICRLFKVQEGSGEVTTQRGQIQHQNASWAVKCNTILTLDLS